MGSKISTSQGHNLGILDSRRSGVGTQISVSLNAPHISFIGTPGYDLPPQRTTFSVP